MTLAKKKSGCFSMYRPPTPENLAYFFEELIDCLSKGSESYENFIILGDFNIDVKVAVSVLGKLEKICDLFNLTNLKHRYEACFTWDHKSSIDLIPINTPKSFQNTCVAGTGLSDFHKLISTFFKTQITCLKRKIAFYRNCRHFEDSRFLEDLNST